jgi:hypothetical protein
MHPIGFLQISLLAVALLLVGLTDCKTSSCTIDATNYDQSCTQASDCVAVASGDFCSANACTCENAAISASAATQYQNDLSKAVQHPVTCPCPTPPTVECNQGTCQIVSLPPPAPSCDDYFQAVYGAQCPGNLVPPAVEFAREQARFDAQCTEGLALQGNGLTATRLEACVAAIQSGGCTARSDPQGPCSFYALGGSLGAGIACAVDSQCQSAACAGSSVPFTGPVPPCGSCEAGGAAGQACTGGAARCVQGLACDSTGQCVANVYAGAGASCNPNIGALCNPGLYCDPYTNQCTATGGEGDACLGYVFDDTCTLPLVCPAAVGSHSTCQPPGGAGAHCNQGTDCMFGLACDSLAEACAPVTWVNLGETCNDHIMCIDGYCLPPAAGLRTCMPFVPDGQSCTHDTTCDAFAVCVYTTLGAPGICALEYPTCP